MLDIKLIRHHPDQVRQALGRRGLDGSGVDQVLEMDRRRRELVTETDQMKNRRNVASRELGRLKQAGQDIEAQAAEMRALGDAIKSNEVLVGELDQEQETLLAGIPNLPAPDTPDGPDESANIEVRRWGTIPEYSFMPRPHWDLARDLDLVDFDRAVKIAGARFVMMKGMGARLERALISFMLDLHTSEHGYQEFLTPFLVNSRTLFGTGQLPKFEEDLFRIEGGEYYLIPTSEVPLTAMHQDEILAGESLPRYYTAYSACFRSEAGAAGKDTRGLTRVHQFDKVELVKITFPERSGEELETMVHDAEEVLRRLELPYRVVQMCTGDLGFSAAKKYDLEFWAPGQKRYVEVSSCSNCTDFQARRAQIRFRRTPGDRAELVHTLNGSGLAVGRTLSAIMEVYQREDGSLGIPRALRPYLGGIEEIRGG